MSLVMGTSVSDRLVVTGLPLHHDSECLQGCVYGVRVGVKDPHVETNPPLLVAIAIVLL
jgi:hypothetical protein